MVAQLVGFFRGKLRELRDNKPTIWFMEHVPVGEDGSHTMFNLLRKRGSYEVEAWPRENYELCTSGAKQQIGEFLAGQGFRMK